MLRHQIYICPWITIFSATGHLTTPLPYIFIFIHLWLSSDFQWIVVRILTDLVQWSSIRIPMKDKPRTPFAPTLFGIPPHSLNFLLMPLTLEFWITNIRNWFCCQASWIAPCYHHQDLKWCVVPLVSSLISAFQGELYNYKEWLSGGL